MSDIDLTDKSALSMHLRSKTPLGRLTDAEVHVVLDYLVNIGFGAPITPSEPAPEAIELEPAPPAPVIDPPPTELAPPPAS